MSQTTQNQDFQPLPQYSQSISTNESWVAITTTRKDPDGSITQRVALEFKPKN
jgi:hypothetical protein